MTLPEEIETEENKDLELPTKISEETVTPELTKEEEEKNKFKQLAAGFGILFFFLMYGVIQEKIMTRPWVEGGPLFTYSAYLVLSNRVVALSVALIILLAKGESIVNVAPLHKYFAISITNTLATFCQYEALKYVSFPTQTLGKCGKTIPVLILGTLISGKKYKLSDYAICVAITIGCAIFIMTGDINSSEKTDSTYGLVFMLGYMFLDGFTSVFQEKLFKGYKMSTYQQMLYVNMCSGCISLLMLLFKDDLFPAIEYSFNFPAFFAASIGLSLCATGGQLVIYYTIKNFGALFFAIVMTTRSVFSILLSCLIFFHPLTFFQWVGAGTVFSALYYKSSKKKSKR